LAGTETAIVQCKRYAPHRFEELHRIVKKEKKKLDLIKPQRYVLVTSVGLSPTNKDKLIKTLEPWCKSTADIYGPSELNGLLRENPDIERAHFKLWISSTAVLEQIVHSRIFNVTHSTIESTKACLSRIVMHDGVNRALEMLDEDHHSSPLERFKSCHRFRSLSQSGLYGLAKELVRVTVEHIDTAALRKIVTPSDKEKWGSLKSLEKVLATAIGETNAHSALGPLHGIYNLRLADAHNASHDLEDAYALVRVDRTLPFVMQGRDLLVARVNCLHDVADVL
jgi:hypothetical protein